jgi:uroporphyrinogen-III synthase
VPEYPAGTLMRRIEAERLNGLVVSSGQGLEHLQQMAAADWPRVACLPLFVPSPRVAEQARAAGAQQVVDCRGASATALLAAVQRSAAPAS